MINLLAITQAQHGPLFAFGDIWEESRMKQQERSKTVKETKPFKGRLSSLFSRDRSDNSKKNGDRKESDWHPCSGPFPTD